MLETYGPLRSIDDNRNNWTLPTVLADRAKIYSTKRFLRHGDRDFSYGEMDDFASRFAGNLIREGVSQGDRILLYLDNSAEYVIAWFGVSRAGAVEVPTNTSYFGGFLRHALQITSPRAIVVEVQYLDRFMELADELERLNPIIVVLGEQTDEEMSRLGRLGHRCIRFNDLLISTGEADLPQLRPHDLSSIMFTSGTTGPSKGVMMSNAQLYFFAVQGINLVQLTEDDVYMAANPLFHGNAQFLSTYPSLISGASVVLYEKFSPSRFSERLRDSRATVTNWVGVMMDWVAKQPSEPGDADNRLRCVLSAPTAWSVKSRVAERFGIEAFVEAFGQTEICIPVMTPYGVDRPEGAVGLAVSDWFDVRLADMATDIEVAPGEVGEFQVRSKEPWTLNSGYYGMPEATASARRNLWFHTGDALRTDNSGWFYFVDRLKDSLRRRGENISSYEVEQPILAHPNIAICAAIGVPADEEAGEDEVAIFVVARPGSALAPEEVAEWSDLHLPRFLQPRYIHVVDDLPMTPSGKIQKVRLRELGTDGAWDRSKQVHGGYEA